jgi:signal transduction histidine kinase
VRVIQRTWVVRAQRTGQATDYDNLLWPDIKASLPHLLPIVAALLASAAITIGAIARATVTGWKGEGWPIIVIFSLLLLVILRQAITCLDDARLRREMAVAPAREQVLIDLNRRIDEFFGVLSHEIRTPLASVQGYLQLLARRFDGWRSQDDGVAAPRSLVRLVASVSTLLRYCLESLGRLTHLANDLVDDTRIHDGRLALRLAPCDLGLVVRHVVEAQRALESGRTITLELPPGGPVLVVADADRIAQVVTNYLTNALKYSMEDRPVAVRLEVEGNARGKGAGAGGLARVSVRDDGPGLSLVDQVHVWERFPRIDAVTVQSGSGVSVGLGLSISKALIEHHGGEVGVESAVGKGSTFWFILPLGTLAPPARPTPSS